MTPLGLPLDSNDIFAFFAVLIRFTVLMAVFPLVGENTVPVQVKILLGTVLSFLLYPSLVAQGFVHPEQAAVWTGTTETLVKTIIWEAVFGVALGFASKIVFDMIVMSGDLIGTWMGFSSASQYDPFYNGQSQVISKILYALGMLLFVSMDGHFYLFRAAAGSYQLVPIGGVKIGAAYGLTVIEAVSQMLRLALQMSAPAAIVFLCVNVFYGVVSRAMPQLNVLMLSFSVSALVGLFVLGISLPEMNATLRGVFGEYGESLWKVMRAMQSS